MIHGDGYAYGSGIFIEATFGKSFILVINERSVSEKEIFLALL